MGKLAALPTKIRPAFDDEKAEVENRNSGNSEFAEKVPVALV
jgi:hypothetical protein